MNPAAIAALVAVSGGVGAVARFVLDGTLRGRLRWVVPSGTMIINVSGSLLLGVLTGIVLFHAVPTDWRVVLGTGFLGGYTTFSTYALEIGLLLQRGQHGLAALYAGGSVALGLAGLFGGMKLARLVLG